MVFSFFKMKPVIEDGEVKPPTPAAKPAPMTFDEALAAQAAAEGRVAESAAPVAAPEPEPVVVPVAPIVETAVPEPALAAEPPVAAADVAQQAPVAANVSAEATAKPASPAAVASEQPEVLGQMDTMKATREDVIAAYKIFLGRVPESMEVVDPRVGVAPVALLVDFLASKEFLDQAPKAQLVLAVAKKILDERKQAEGSPSAEAGSPATPAPVTQG
jgi:hypothetical protein